MARVIKGFFVLCLLVFAFKPFCYSQQPPYEKTSDKEWVFKEKTYDEVWSATVKALMQLKYQVTSSDKNGGIISATKQKGFFNRKQAQETMESFQIFVEKIEEGTKVSCQFTKKAGSLFQSDQSKSLLKKIAEDLYGKEGKKTP